MALAVTADGERYRLAALERYHAVEGGSDQVYEDLALLAAKALDCSWAAIAFVGEDTIYYRATYGTKILPERRDESFCTYAIAEPEGAFVVENAAIDQRFAHLPMVEGMPFVRSYIGSAFGHGRKSRHWRSLRDGRPSA